MFIPYAEFKKLLSENKLINTKALDKAKLAADKNKQNLEQYLVDNGLVSDKDFLSLYSQVYQTPIVNIKGAKINKNILHLIPEPLARNHKVVAFDRTGETLKIAMVDPTDLETIEFIKKKTGLNIQIHLDTLKHINYILGQYRKSLKTEFSNLIGLKSEQRKQDPAKLKQLADDLPTVRIVNTILDYAIFEGASDIHIEPLEKDIIIRYRVDGMLKEVMTLPKELLAGLAARIKVLAKLKIDEHRLPQDGRFKLETEDYKIAFRVSVLPVFDGEKIVMRLLNESGQVLTFKDLGFDKNSLPILERNIKRPNGMILVTGPTGSGKTTTLYSILNILNQPTVNISTIEDPIEYRIPRISQSQVAPKIGFTFANGLRSLLRQDPDIIMVGEIRDNETADMAINAAMTGHLVLSTLHTNDAPGALPRLIDMKIEPFLIASTVNVIIAQRLVRKICPNCIQSYNLDKKAVDYLKQEVNLKNILLVMQKQGMIKSLKESLGSVLFFKGAGCSQCGQEGYKGRLGIFEVLEVTPNIAKLIITQASADEISNFAQKQNMITMIQDGFMKAKQGLTTIEEVLRVSKE